MPDSRIKDEELYERLREEGNSKEKSARIANAAAKEGRSKIGQRGGNAGAYEDMTVAELRKKARKLGLTNYSDLKKKELIKELRKH